MFNRQSEETSKDELRKKKRKQAQFQAYAMLAAGILAVVLILVGICNGVGAIVKKSGESKTKQTAQNKKTESNKEAGTEKDTETKTEEGSEGDAEDSQSIAEQVAEASAKEPEEEKSEEELQKEALQTYVKSIVDSMTIEEKVAGIFFVTPESITGTKTVVAAGSTTSAAILKYPVGGIIYDTQNIQDSSQFRDVIYNTKSFSKYPLLTAVMEEGGENSPLTAGGLVTEPILGQKEIAETSKAAGAYSAGISVASTLYTLGVDINFGPVSDVTLNEKSVIASRSYGTDKTQVLSFTKNMLKGMSDQSVYGCLKYFPGQGDVTIDSSKGRSTSKRTKADLESLEYDFVKMAVEENVPFLMVSHVTMPEITGDNTPASLSSVFMTDMLRTELGYEGIIITDYMNKAAITRYYKPADAAVMAIQAGADMILAPSDFKKAYAGVIKAVEEGELTEERIDESLCRIFMLKYKDSVDSSLNTEAEETTEETDTTVQETEEVSETEYVDEWEAQNGINNKN